MNNKRTKLILLIISLLLLVFNFIQMILSVGVAFILFHFSLVLSYSCFLYFKNHSTYLDDKFSTILTLGMAALVPILTILHSPRYYYKQAQKIIISEEYINKDVSLLDLDRKITPVYENINFLIDKGYIIGLQEADNNEVYYFFNPVTGEYSKTDITNWE